ncbi:RagB/SusD family nutrient uptake outer membrane protein [Pseudoxanthomonas sp. SGD-10]|nr:RagB/SusD family nutrient uptake outer membrane protein [Pseudoxanthomonas sp. SGD-10]
MKQNKNIKKFVLAVLTCTITFSSCQKMFDIKPEDTLAKENMYQSVYDADAAILGLYGKFSSLADRYVLLNELRGDLLEYTHKSDVYVKEINNHEISEGNPYASPKPFYELIINCNDAMHNFQEMKDKNILDATQFYQRYTEAGMLRTWLYLQLGIHFGSVPYVTDPLVDINSVKDASKYPKLNFDELLDKLLEFTNSIPSVYLNQNTSSASPTLIMAMNGYPIQNGVFKFFIHRKSLVADLNLWKGNYLEAAKIYKNIMELDTYSTTSPDQRIDRYDTYRIVNDNTGTLNLMTTGTLVPWSAIFTDELAAIKPNIERMWTLPLNRDYSPGNPLLEMFDASLNYVVKPSQLSVDKWDEQIREDGSLTDRRGLNSSYITKVGEELQVAKYALKYSSLTPFEKTGIWVLYRAAVMHLRYAEAANRLGYGDVAGVLINDGFKTKGKTYANYPSPFDFDGSTGTVNGNWYRNIGIRGRAVNQSVPIDPLDEIDTENKIIEEAALELAFEGHRWPDLLRVALRREATEPDFLANKVAAKFEKAGLDASAVRAKLSNKANWYLPFNW